MLFLIYYRHTCCYNFLSARIPSIFSQINVRGSIEMHEVVQEIDNFKKSVQILKRVHQNSNEVVNLANALKRVFNQAGQTISLFSLLPGLGHQLKALLKMEAMTFLIGVDAQEMALEILKGSAEQAKFAFNSSGKTLSTWRSKFGGDNKRDNKRGASSSRGGFNNSKRGRPNNGGNRDQNGGGQGGNMGKQAFNGNN